jgi:hypothetical protein
MELVSILWLLTSVGYCLYVLSYGVFFYSGVLVRTQQDSVLQYFEIYFICDVSGVDSVF